MGFIDKPQQLWLRKAAFQVHLWMGILVCLYMLAMGVSGSILVFKEELAARTTTPQGRPPYPEGAPVVPVDTVLARVRDVYPGSTPLGVYAPGPGNGAWMVTE